MTIKNSNLSSLIEDIHISKYGDYYFFKDFIISEIKEGITFSWEVAQELLPAVFKHYGSKPSLSYITNRVNNYSVNPADWYKFFNSNDKTCLKGYAMVSYTEAGWVNSIIEKLFVQTKVESFTNLYEAIDWVSQLRIKSK